MNGTYKEINKMKKISCKRGFTLIELLVVVLIIGILAAVAVPQYNKAVRKTRLAEVAGNISTIFKALDAYVLQNGYNDVYFTGTDKTAELDISFPWTSEAEWFYADTKLGGWRISCSSAKLCNIYFQAGDWLAGQAMDASKDSSGKITLDMNPSQTYVPEVCRWWKELYGANSFTGDAADTCPAYL